MNHEAIVREGLNTAISAYYDCIRTISGSNLNHEQKLKLEWMYEDKVKDTKRVLIFLEDNRGKVFDD